MITSTQSVNIDHVIARIIEISDELAGMTKPTPSQIEAGRATFDAACEKGFKLSDEERQQFEHDFAFVTYDNLEREIAMLQETVDNRELLCHCPCRYVLTESKRLASPAGFHPSTRIFLAGEYMIHCDEIPTKTPAKYAHDLSKVCGVRA